MKNLIRSIAVMSFTAFGITAKAATYSYTFDTEGYTITVTSNVPVAFENNTLTYGMDLSMYEVGNGYFATPPLGSNYGEALNTLAEFKLKDGYAVNGISIGSSGEYSLKELFPDSRQGASVYSSIAQSVIYGSIDDEYGLRGYINAYLSQGLGPELSEYSGPFNLESTMYVPLEEYREFYLWGNSYHYTDAGSVMQYVCEWPYDNCYVRETQSIAALKVNLAWMSFDVALVPEPSAYGMLGLGLGVLGFAARRRKKGE